MSISPVNIIIGATATEAIAKFQEVNNELGKMETKALKAGAAVSDLDKAARISTASLMVLGGAAAAFGVASVKAAMDSQVAYARMDTALKNAGVTSKDQLEAARKLTEQNTKLGFATVDTAQAYGTLVTATGNTKDSQQLLNVAMDLARYKHEDLATAADTLARGTQGSAKAFKEMGITLDANLPKQQAINKAFDELQAKLSGQNTAYLGTFQGKIDVMTAQFKALEENIGGKLIPILTSAMSFVEKYGSDLLTLAAIVGGTILAIKAYTVAQTALLAINGFLATSLAAQIANEELLASQAAITAAATGVLTESEAALMAATTAATGPMVALSAAMDANPIGAMVLAVTALVAALFALKGVFKDLTNSGGTVTSGVAGRGVGASAQANAGKHVDPATGEWVSDTASGSMPTLGGMPGAFTDISTGFSLSNYTAGKIKTSKSGTSKTDPALAEIAKLNSDLVKVNAKYLSDLNAAQDAFNVAQTNAQVTRNDAQFKAQQTFNNFMLAENKRYADQKAALAQNNADQITAINKAGQDQLASIVKQSVDLLRNAYNGATKIDIGSIFSTNISSLGSTLSTQIKNGVQTVVSWWGTSGGAGINGVLGDLTKQLAAAKKLSDDAAKLAGLGYSQTFIQQIVGQGTDIGDQISQSILAASPQQQKQLKDLYTQLDAVSNHGVDQLANSLSKPGSLANEALNQQYADAQAALAQNLATQQASYDKASSDALAQFNTNVGQAEATRDTALSDAAAAYQTAMNSANQQLSKATASAQKTITDSLTAIANEFNTKLANVKSNIASTVQAIGSLKAAIAGSQTLATKSSNTLIPFAQQQQSSTNQRNQFVSDYNNSSMGGTLNVNTNIKVDGSTAPQDIAKAVVAAVKYGGLAGAGAVRGN